MAPELVVRYVGQHAGTALAVQDLMESLRRDSVNLSGTTADNVIRLNLRAGGVFYFADLKILFCQEK